MQKCAIADESLLTSSWDNRIFLGQQSVIGDDEIRKYYILLFIKIFVMSGFWGYFYVKKTRKSLFEDCEANPVL